MSNEFNARLTESTNKQKSRIICALDISYTDRDNVIVFSKNTINMLKDYICAVKLNFHLILPLDLYSEVKDVVDLAHSYGLQAIADIKLNDIGNTNMIALSHLWSAGFDAATVSSFIGVDGLREAIASAHEQGNGIISLVYMSHKGASQTYGIQVTDPDNQQTMPMYELFLKWAEELHADGIIVGANAPEIIKKCAKRIKGRTLIMSPGIGWQGGDARTAIASGSDYVIVGRSILEAEEPDKEAAKLRKLTWEIPTS